ncbi:MAG: hypothetical protein ACRDCF_00010 [Mycoplasmoidaceae bacterium]
MWQRHAVQWGTNRQVYWDELESSKLMTLGPDISPFGQIWIIETLT